MEESQTPLQAAMDAIGSISDAPKTEETQVTNEGKLKVETPDASAKKFETLARIEKKNKQQARELQEAKRLFSEERAGYQKLIDAHKNSKEDPFAYLEAGNLTYEELIAKGLQHDPSKKQMTAAEARLAEIERRLEESEKGKIKSEQDYAVSVYKSEIDAHIAKTSNFIAIKNFGSSELVYNVVEEYFTEHQKVLSVDEACGMVEEGLRIQIREAHKKVNDLKLPFLGESPKSESSASVSHNKTLSNDAFTSPDRGDDIYMSREDRIRKALASIG